MKRRLLIVAIFLLAGAVVNVAVAWALAASFTQGVRSNPPITEEFSQLLSRIPTDEAGEMWVPHDRPGMYWDHDNNVMIERTPARFSGIGIRQECKWARRRTDRGGVNQDLYHDLTVWSFRAGFPMLSLHGDTANVQGQRGPSGRWGQRGPSGQWGQFKWRRGVWITERAGAFPYAIPFYAVWPGFLVNTLLYALVLWLLWGGPFRLRRFIRVRRGLCPKCAYPMGESAGCTECGKTLPQRARVTT